jgi:hypothetical protein
MNSKINFGPSQPGYRFKPGECVVKSNTAEEFRQGKCTQEQIDGMKMLVAGVGTDKRTKLENYRLLYYSSVKAGENLPGLRWISGF